MLAQGGLRAAAGPSPKGSARPQRLLNFGQAAPVTLPPAAPEDGRGGGAGPQAALPSPQRADRPGPAAMGGLGPLRAAALRSRIWGFEALLRVGAGLLPRSALGQRQNKTKRGAAEGKKKKIGRGRNSSRLSLLF